VCVRCHALYSTSTSFRVGSLERCLSCYSRALPLLISLCVQSYGVLVQNESSLFRSERFLCFRIIHFFHFRTKYKRNSCTLFHLRQWRPPTATASSHRLSTMILMPLALLLTMVARESLGGNKPSKCKRMNCSAVERNKKITRIFSHNDVRSFS
jgi:hypothetical protein